MLALDILLRWMHILPAVTMVGATIFMRFALHPSLSTLPESQRKELQAAVRGRWAKVVMMSIAMLLVSGLVNTILVAGKYELPKYYHPLLGIKILLALVVFYIASKLVGRSAGAEKFREKAQFWMTVNVVLAVTIICIAGVLKVGPRTEKPPKNAVGSVFHVGETVDGLHGRMSPLT
jgi:uncharacterized membrane protein